MLSEYYKILYLDYVRALLSIFLLYMCKNLDLYKCLLVEFSFISDHFQRKCLLLLVVENFHDFSVTPFTQLLQYFITISNMIMHFVNILISLVNKNKYSSLSKKQIDSVGSLVELYLGLEDNFFSLSFFETFCPM